MRVQRPTCREVSTYREVNDTTVPAHSGSSAAADPLHPSVCPVVIIDDQPITRSGMERLLREQPRFDVVASVASAGELDAATHGTRYDLAILSLPSGHGRHHVQTIASLAKIAHPVVTAGWDRPLALAGAFRAGARGCVTRQSGPDEMLTALRIVADGGLFICPTLVEQLQAEMGQSTREAPAGLAPREIETARWIALGFTQSQIATRMGLSQATVNTYAKRIRSKLQVSNKAELTRMAIRLGYLADERHQKTFDGDVENPRLAPSPR